MKVVQINSVYGMGSTGSLVRSLHKSLLRDGHDSLVLYGRGRPVSEDGVIRVCGDVYAKANSLLSRMTGIRYGGCFWSTDNVLGIIKRESPDVVHLQCINGSFLNIYRLVTWLKERQIPTVLTLHADFMFTANCGSSLDCEKWREGCGDCPRLRAATKSWFFDRTAASQYRMVRAFEGFEQCLSVVSVSPWLKERAMESPVLKGASHQVILNGIDTSVFHPYDDSLRLAFNDLRGKRVLLHVTAHFSDDPYDLKGGSHIIELAKRLIGDSIVVLVAGEVDLEGDVPDNLLLLGRVDSQSELSRYYSLADLTVVASKQETFSLVCVESLCCGTPVVGFCAGGPESISLSEYSCFVEQGNDNALEKCVRGWIDVKGNLPEGKIWREASVAYSKEAMVRRYERAYRGVLCR